MASSAEQDGWIKRVLGVAAGGASPPGDGQSGTVSDPMNQALRRWSHEREIAIASLRSLSRAIVGAADPEGGRAIIMVQAIIRNLTAEPSTPQQVAELTRYLNDDDIIADVESPNPFGISVQLQAPLLRALDPIRQLTSR